MKWMRRSRTNQMLLLEAKILGIERKVLDWLRHQLESKIIELCCQVSMLRIMQETSSRVMERDNFDFVF